VPLKSGNVPPHRRIKHMTFVNWITVGVVVVIFLVGIGLRVYHRRKIRNLDGFMGIVSNDAEEKDK